MNQRPGRQTLLPLALLLVGSGFAATADSVTVEFRSPAGVVEQCIALPPMPGQPIISLTTRPCTSVKRK